MRALIRNRPRLLLALLCATSLLVSETGIRLAFSQPWFLRRAAVNSSSWWRLRWIARGVPSEKNVARYHSIYRFDKELGWRVRPRLDRRVMANNAILSTNSRGLRGARDHNAIKTAGTIRIVAIGDSFTFGEEVSDDSTFPSQIETLMPETEVLNMGVGGYGHDQMALYLEREGVGYAPDAVVLGFVADDMRRNVLRFRDYWKPRFSLVNGRLVLEDRAIPTVAETVEGEFLRLKSIDLLEILFNRVGHTIGLNQRRERDITEALLDRIIEMGLRLKAKIVFAYLPLGFEITDDERSAGEAFFNAYCESRMKRYDGPFSCIDARPEFRAQARAGRRFRGGHLEGHYDAAGQLLVAKEITRQLGLVLAGLPRGSRAPGASQKPSDAPAHRP